MTAVNPNAQGMLLADGTRYVPEFVAMAEKIFVVNIYKVNATWYYFTTNPQGGGFGSNHCGSKKVALGKATQAIPAGSEYVLISNGKLSRAIK